MSEPPPRPQPTQHVNVAAEVEIVETEPRARRHGRRRVDDLQLLLRLDQAVGEVADGKLAPALEHGDALAAAGSREAATPPP